MPFATHPNATTPSPELGLWRYCNFTKFVSLIAGRALWFARSDNLGDPFELSVPNWVPAITYDLDTKRLQRLPKLGKRRWKSCKAPNAIDQLARAFEMTRSWLFVNCWYSGDRDSPAMWSTYGSTQDGVAVRSTVAQLSQAFQSEQDVYLGKVHYLDYSPTEPPPEWINFGWGNQLTYAYIKRLSFVHEHEVRAFISDHKSSALPGLPIPVNLTTLLSEVTVAPFAPQWFLDLVQTCCKQAGLSVPVRRSDIGGKPNWRLSLHPALTGVTGLPETPTRTPPP